MRPDPKDSFWTVPVETALAQLAARPEGLSAAEAERRLAASGRNVFAEAPRRRVLAKIVRRLAEPLILILIIAAAISGATGDWASFAIIVAIVLGSITLDVFQEHRAEIAADALKRSVAVRSDVQRDGRTIALPVEEIVPGDIVELRAGDLVPADGIVLESRGAHVDEALMTGEPYPVEKRPGACETSVPAEAFNALFSGTSVVSGQATMLVITTGAQTRFGGIAESLRADQPPTAFERGLHAVGMLILRLTLFLVLFVLLAHIVFARPILQSFLFAIALAVGLTPGLLPMIMTVTLSRGALRMADRHVVVKRLASIHNLGAMDVLCTDKTGTLTEARISLADYVDCDGAPCERVIELAAVNSHFETGIRSPLDEAILAHTTDAALAHWQRIADVPFDFERRRVSVLAEHDGQRLLIVKGAPEEVLAHSTQIEASDGTTRALDAGARARLIALHEDKTAHGFRCLGVAVRTFASDFDRPRPDDENDLVFVGLCVFVDPPKASAASAIARLEAAGVRVKIISGDAAATVQHLVEALRIPAHGLLTGAEIARMSDATLAARATKVDLFARVSPDQKTRIIHALQVRGHVVGFIGDGINDAPAIRAADVGLSVDGATDVARAAADMILLAPDLGVVADGVAEGRRTYANIMKYLRMGTSSNFGNMLSMAFASLFLAFLPLTPIQVLLNNLLYDLSEIGIPFDTVEPTEVARPHSWDMSELLRFTLIMGPLSSMFDIATFVVLLQGFGADAETFRTAWFVESMATQILVIFFIRTRVPAWRSSPHPFLVATSVGALVIAIVLALTPLGAVFGFAGLAPSILAATAALVAAYLIAAEALKPLAMVWSHPHVKKRTRGGRRANHSSL